MNITRLVIISQDASTREHLRRILERDGTASVVGEAGNGHQGLSIVGTRRPDLVLIDSDLPGLSGYSIAATIKRSYLDTQVILLAPVADFDHLYASMKCGGATALRRDADAATVRRALRAVLIEQQRLHPWPIQQAEAVYADGFVPDQGELIQRTLTDRQAAVLDCMLLGLTTREMPEALGVTKYRVQKDLGEMMQELGVNRKLGAIALAFERGWTSVGRRPTVVMVAQPANALTGPVSGFHSPEWAPFTGRGDMGEIAM